MFGLVNLVQKVLHYVGLVLIVYADEKSLSVFEAIKVHRNYADPVKISITHLQVKHVGS